MEIDAMIDYEQHKQTLTAIVFGSMMNQGDVMEKDDAAKVARAKRIVSLINGEAEHDL